MSALLWNGKEYALPHRGTRPKQVAAILHNSVDPSAQFKQEAFTNEELAAGRKIYENDRTQAFLKERGF